MTAESSGPRPSPWRPEGFAARLGAWPLLGIGAVVALMASYIHAFGVNVPFWDEWELGKFYKEFSEGSLSVWALLAAKHNEHLVGVSFTLMLLHHLATGFDVKAILYTNLLLQIASLLIVFRLSRPLLAVDHTRHRQQLVIALLMLSFAPYTNILWGFQTAWYLVTLLLLCVVLTLETALQQDPVRLVHILGAALLAALASLCSVQGLGVWIAGCVFIFVRENRKLTESFQSWALLTWLACSALGIAAYTALSLTSPVAGATSTSATLSSLSDPIGLARFWVLAVSTVFGALPPRAGYVVGATVTSLVGLAVWVALRSKARSQYAFPLTLIAFAATFLAMVAVGRLPLGAGAARESRYGAYVLLALVGAYLIVTRATSADTRRSIALATARGLVSATAVVSFLSASYFALVHGHEWRMERGVAASVLLQYHTQPPFVVERMLYGSVSTVEAQAVHLQRHGQSIFADGIDGVPAVARPYMSPVPAYQLLMIENPRYFAALQRLWSAYVAGPDVRKVLPYTSGAFPQSLVKWASGASVDNGHYLSPFLAPYADAYAGLQSDPGRMGANK